MKAHVLDFIRRGLVACGFGPMVLVVCYWMLHRQGAIETLTVSEVCLGVVSLSALAFLAGGMNVLYQVERLPLMVAIFIHGFVLYAGYLGTYLLNGWLRGGVAPILVFSAIFVLSYLVIWAIIYSVTQKRTKRINEMLRSKQKGE